MRRSDSLNVLIAMMLYLVSQLSFAASCPEEMSSGWCWPTGTSDIGSFYGWHAQNPFFGNRFHLGKDIAPNVNNHNVYAISDGTVLISRTNVDSYGGVYPDDTRVDGGGVVIRHALASGDSIDVLYAHLNNPVSSGTVVKGQVIGTLNNYVGAPRHLHFAIAQPPRSNSSYDGSGGEDVWAGYTATTNDNRGFVENPLSFLSSNPPFLSFSSISLTCWGDVCWEEGASPGCINGERWAIANDNTFTEASSNICNDISYQCIQHAQPEPKENKWWRSWWQVVRNIFAQPVSASTCEAATVTRTFTQEDSTYRIVSGAGRLSSDYTGAGINTLPTDTQNPQCLPNFTTIDTWLETPEGTENYRYSDKDAQIKMKARFKNDGCADSPEDIEVRFYLSKGFKEDAHSDWIHVGTDNIKKSNMEVGDTHTETEGLPIATVLNKLGYGTHNIVACADRTKNSNNGDGDVIEEHKSDNCGDEAVFQICANQNGQGCLTRAQISALMSVITTIIND